MESHIQPIMFCTCACRDESTGHQTDDDQARVLATPFEQFDISPPSVTTANPMTTFKSPVHAVTEGLGISEKPSDEPDFEKDDLALIEKPLDDIEP